MRVIDERILISETVKDRDFGVRDRGRGKIGNCPNSFDQDCNCALPKKHFLTLLSIPYPNSQDQYDIYINLIFLRLIRLYLELHFTIRYQDCFWKVLRLLQ